MRTVQLDDGSRLQQELREALKESVRPVVLVISGPDLGRRIHLSGTAIVGRDAGAGVALADSRVSWRHARLEDRGGAWALVDMGSTNGTLLNGRPVKEAPLASGDKIAVGQTVLCFELHDSLARAYDEKMLQLLDVDDLSGLYVRRKFDREVAGMVDAARAASGSVGLLAADMDGIKQINDTHGHLFGAYVIGETGRVIAGVVGCRGIGSRFGGDEYCVALPGMNRDQSFAVAAEIHAAVNAYPYAREGIPLRPGISIGAASFPAEAGDPVSLFQRADEALYRAKQGGRNRVAL